MIVPISGISFAGWMPGELMKDPAEWKVGDVLTRGFGDELEILKLDADRSFMDEVLVRCLKPAVSREYRWLEAGETELNLISRYRWLREGKPKPFVVPTPVRTTVRGWR
jgi:hypothetical protein